MQRIKSFNDFIDSNLRESVFGNQFRELRHIKEGFFSKLLRNVTGKTKDRIESVTRQIELFKDFITPPKITNLSYTPKESDDGRHLRSRYFFCFSGRSNQTQILAFKKTREVDGLNRYIDKT